MNNSQKNMKNKPFTGRRFFLYIVSFFVVVIAANGIMAYFAIATFSGLETDDAYRKGRDYNETLEAARKQAELGWQEDVSFVKVGRGGLASQHIIIKLVGAETETDLKAKFLIRRPANNTDDQYVLMAETGPAKFEGVVEGLAQGKWKWSLVIRKSDSEIFRKNGEIIIGDN